MSYSVCQSNSQFRSQGTRQQVVEQCVHLDEDLINEIAENLNYKVLIKLVQVETPLNIKYLEEFPIGHQYAILVYLTGDMRKFYYKGVLKIEQVFENTQFLSYVVLHLQTDGIRGRYFDNFDQLDAYYQDLHDKKISSNSHKFKVYEGSQAENKDNARLKYTLKKVLHKKYSVFGNVWKLFLDKWNCRDFTSYLKSSLGR
ncbi:unnamed protein product (macronuclear) [Paramecium tetraurelia]|uniref:Uncharacterized protein n=1 Tax=Paramecium tetraurelia TaxID=5888 RepID=A0CLY2_PARTE|nr:uncharacterized protein GSPATT00008278001 [Paramecium tetraurelia]CAK71799.1 unnamed protein product [Paramecium tetraurelia]|eukprot:XP_001439196.1 hypothetical protein (macronuclear) [Paramecium tetraurelia strain d4-2]